MRQHVERLLARGDSRAAGVSAPEKHLVAEIMAARIEVESVRVALRAGERRTMCGSPRPSSKKSAHAAARVAWMHPLATPSRSAHPHRAAPALCETPSGQNMRERRHVGLRIAAVDAERVQLHHLARVVLVDTFELALSPGAVG